MTTTRHIKLAALATALAAGVAGCGSAGADKAGGSGAPAVLRIALADDGIRPSVEQPEYFAAQVRKLSHGSVRVEIVRTAAGPDVPDSESAVVGLVRDGRFELGWLGSRVWDRQGVKSFQALQAPFLITDQELLDDVVSGPIGKQMIASLHGAGVEGLALLPGLLRHAFGYKHAFTSPADFRGARVRVRPSRATDAMVLALGGTPVHLGNRSVSRAVAQGKIDAGEGSLGTDPVGTWLTANVILFPKAITLFANQRALARLSDAQRAAVRTAAARAVAHAIDSAPAEDELAAGYCKAGRVVLAQAGDVAALERASRPVYGELERDPATRAAIAAIREQKAKAPAAPSPDIPAECSEPVKAAAAPATDPSVLDGTYRWHRSVAGARRAGIDPAEENLGSGGAVITMTLRDGRWLLQTDDVDHGTFELRGDRLIFDWPRVGYKLTFDVTRRKDHSLDVQPVLPMDSGDQFVWASESWKRVGPPVRKVPAS